MPVGVEEDVLGLQVPVGHVDVVVQVREDQCDLGGVEAYGVQGEASRASEVGEDFAAGGVV